MQLFKTTLSLLLALCTTLLQGQVAQIAVPRIERMPNEPTPYNVRDWREVALQYDAFVYDLGKTGQHLPLSYLNDRGLNYPQYPSFGLVTYVGTFSPQGNEAINVLPSLVGASLVGVDKTTQHGRNWVRMSQDFFNKNNGHFIYLNNISGGSGGDWWYDLMPNLFFYQLYDLYPDAGGEAGFQFTSIANRFAQAVRALGGSDTPWSKAFMDYRAFDFLSMQPNPIGVKQPEAAGAYAWVLYHAYKKTGNPEYLKAAEWSLEFLSEWTLNPSYELQLPYGTYVAAKMNAELGTNYDIEKMINWSFDRGFLRGWGTIVGRWNGFDVSGLVGEANDNGNDYAFQLNGVQQAAALVPMVRYDKRFARAIGKWMLNLTNATRLFFPGFLPGFLQDASDWSNANDPDRVIGYEALRERWAGQMPFSTGDALRGGWAATNLALYGTSSIGYLGAIVSKTNVDRILEIDLLPTDFYKDAAYPSRLYFNPYNTPQTIAINLGDTPVDVYESLSETFLMQGQSGTVNINIPPNEALVVVLTPAGGAVTYHRNKMLVNGIVVDYMQSVEPFAWAPRIQALAALQSEVETGDSTPVFVKAFDRDSETLTYEWSASGGEIIGEGTEVIWRASDVEGSYTLQVIVTDEQEQRDTAILLLQIVAEINKAPEILELRASENYIVPDGVLQLFCEAIDANNDPLTYTWSAEGGSFVGIGNTVSWTAPASEGTIKISVLVTDDKGLSATAAITVLVKDFVPTSGNLIAYYPFSGNANDASGNQLHGTAIGARLTDDRSGAPSSAYYFNGIANHINVPFNPLLNFQDAITVSSWFNAEQLPDRESFLLSHGSWQNRWKISFTPERKIRWTINSTAGIRDLDSETPLETNRFYHVTATYDGQLLALYINGQLHSFKELSGKIRTANLPLLIGQMLPGDANYNFRGVIDEVKIFDYALSPAAAAALYEADVTTSAETIHNQRFRIEVAPNPVREQLTVQLPWQELSGNSRLTIYNTNGQLMQQLSAIGHPSGTIIIDTKTWTTGLYTILLQSSEGVGTARFIKN
ncbi:MAG TPA: T9SS type A sorting domain-containing protein [Saprospiraceae bacterium]|nr:T9SS type A sorting domain-containing protein [Saprospiraceae bacterium]HMP22547.1 T9SS type A sorting domain-containing protein [Saprospiraceae bacterium]